MDEHAEPRLAEPLHSLVVLGGRLVSVGARTGTDLGQRQHGEGDGQTHFPTLPEWVLT